MFTVFHKREFNRDRSICENDIFRLNKQCIFALTNLDGFRILEFGPTMNKFHARIFQKSFNTFVESINDCVLPCDGAFHFEFGRPWNTDAHVPALLGMSCKFVKRVSSMDQCFGRNAPANQACATSTLTFNDNGVHSKLTSSNSGDIASWSSANNQHFAISSFHFITSHEDGCWVLQHRFEELNQTCTIVPIYNAMVP